MDLKKKGKRVLELVNSQDSSDLTVVATGDNVSRERKSIISFVSCDCL